MVKMLKPTSYNGISYQCGDECKEDAVTQKRWVANGIAEQSNSDLFDEPPVRKGRGKMEKAEQTTKQSASFAFLGDEVNKFVGKSQNIEQVANYSTPCS